MSMPLLNMNVHLCLNMPANYVLNGRMCKAERKRAPSLARPYRLIKRQLITHKYPLHLSEWPLLQAFIIKRGLP